MTREFKPGDRVRVELAEPHPLSGRFGNIVGCDEDGWARVRMSDSLAVWEVHSAALTHLPREEAKNGEAP